MRAGAAALVVLLVTLILSLGGVCLATETGGATECRAYQVALGAAHAALERGDRAQAIAALRAAQAALRACQREEARGTGLLAQTTSTAFA